jgi:hypothetical protein
MQQSLGRAAQSPGCAMHEYHGYDDHNAMGLTFSHLGSPLGEGHTMNMGSPGFEDCDNLRSYAMDGAAITQPELLPSAMLSPLDLPAEKPVLFVNARAAAFSNACMDTALHGAQAFHYDSLQNIAAVVGVPYEDDAKDLQDTSSDDYEWVHSDVDSEHNTGSTGTDNNKDHILIDCNGDKVPLPAHAPPMSPPKPSAALNKVEDAPVLSVALDKVAGKLDAVNSLMAHGKISEKESDAWRSKILAKQFDSPAPPTGPWGKTRSYEEYWSKDQAAPSNLELARHQQHQATDQTINNKINVTESIMQQLHLAAPDRAAATAAAAAQSADRDQHRSAREQHLAAAGTTTAPAPRKMSAVLKQHVYAAAADGEFNEYEGRFVTPNPKQRSAKGTFWEKKSSARVPTVPENSSVSVVVPNARNPCAPPKPSTTAAALKMARQRNRRDRAAAGHKSPERISVKQIDGSFAKVLISNIPSNSSLLTKEMKRMRRHNTAMQTTGCLSCKYNYRGCRVCLKSRWRPIDMSVLPLSRRSRERARKAAKDDESTAPVETSTE